MAEPTAAEYLEKLFTDSFKREWDQDENVVRSLPFFATALALSVTLLGLAGEALPPFEFSPSSFRFYVLMLEGALLSGVLWTLASVLWHLFAAIRARTYIIPPPETELIAWTEQIRAFHSAAGLSGTDLERAIVGDLRDLMIQEYAKAAMNARANNVKRLFARTQALSRLIMALTLSFAIAVVIFVDGRVASFVAPVPGGPDVSSTKPADGKATGENAGPAKAGAPQEPVSHQGGAPSMGEGGGHGRQP
ncbi:hypothetical protein [Azospirillum sp. TSO22-1]|uniref:hypothetical protein n=1 Tax=Azospirillum sp. TSO22-1 TaxID=716789 RepID=UPI000D6191B4|nr:hypothetical protein [Azospirillum sp. TSO22-1]PWC37173.1 hypothetical protein TSO221_27990 [Azospirillum sp. TSO22-1]